MSKSERKRRAAKTTGGTEAPRATRATRKAKGASATKSAKAKGTKETATVPLTPETVLPIPNARELRAQLDHYSRPFLDHNLPGDPPSPFVRRWYVEKTRPALRWYCARFGIEVPDWLHGNGLWDRIDDEERATLFGPGPLAPVAFGEEKPRTRRK